MTWVTEGMFSGSMYTWSAMSLSVIMVAGLEFHGRWQVMPKYTDVKKVLVLGSGPIVIGQAAEFDYAGTQACRALKEEGLEVVLVNSNPATIMTDKDIADHVYIERTI